MGETRVDLLHLLEDIRDSYPGPVEETLLMEMVANALDARASSIEITIDRRLGTLTLRDNGRGMNRRELARFHDLATSRKHRGSGIGFAGVGIKLGLLVAREVVTEAVAGGTRAATSWHLSNRYKAPWSWISPPGMVGESGTAVCLAIPNGLSPLLDTSFVENAFVRNFAPLFDDGFRPLLSRYYPNGVTLSVNGVSVSGTGGSTRENGISPLVIKHPRGRTPAGWGYLCRRTARRGDQASGISISTYGKVIHTGWEWLGLRPVDPEAVSGIVEVPELAACLQLNKGDFIRSGRRGATYLTYRKLIQEAVRRQLQDWGLAGAEADGSMQRNARPFERDLQQVLNGLVGDFPLVAAFADRRRTSGGRVGLADGTSNGQLALAPAATLGDAKGGSDSTETADVEALGERSQRLGELGAARRGRGHTPQLKVAFESRPGDPEPARLSGSTVYVNEAHSAFRRAVASRSTGYHVAVSSALAVSEVVAEPVRQVEFMKHFIAAWGNAAR